jgi:purine-cytosine permease-like protein
VCSSDLSAAFMPMIAILAVDYFILKNDFSERRRTYTRFTIWFVGFSLYHFLGSSILIIPAVIFITIIVDRIQKKGDWIASI